jgi:subtilisin family serine protease
MIIASAGNDGRDITSAPRYPASYGLPNVLAVAATDNADQLASWSNYSRTHAAVAAPGTDILTTEIGGGYRKATGTSISTALVSGIAGLIKTVRPWQAPAETKRIITNSVRQIAALNGKVSSVRLKPEMTRGRWAIKDRPVPEIPSIMIPGSNGGMSRQNYESEFGISLSNPAFLAIAAARIGAHEAIAHYLLGDPGHSYEEGITKTGVDYPEVKDLFISEAVKKKLLDICNTGKLP